MKDKQDLSISLQLLVSLLLFQKHTVICWCEMLWAGVQSSCLHRPERTGSWGSWLTCEARTIHKVGFIREKGKATARAAQWSLETSGSLLKWRLGLFNGCFNSGLGYWLGGHGFACTGSLRWVGLFAPYWGNNLVYQPCGRFMRPCDSSSGCRGADL
jgi:hypothetical protein